MLLADAELTEPERRLVQAAGLGELVDLRSGDSGLDQPDQAGGWDAVRTVWAEVLAELLTSRRQPGTGAVRAVKLRGARIAGVLDLEAATLACPLLLEGCSADQPINLRDARAGPIRMPGSQVPGITADQLRTEGNLELNSGFTGTAEVCLSGARIGGRLDLTAATITSHSGRALDADGLTVEQSISCGGLTAATLPTQNMGRVGLSRDRHRPLFTQSHLAGPSPRTCGPACSPPRSTWPSLPGSRPRESSFIPIAAAQYASSAFDSYCTEDEIRRSLGRAGICYDNAVSESFFGAYK